MNTIKVYENPAFKDIMGDTIRPGGFDITKIAFEYCAFQKDACLLDIGCGRGATVEYLQTKYTVQCTGIDRSKKLIDEGLQRNHHLKLIEGTAESLPFENDRFDGVIAECSMSLVKQKSKALSQINRVLKRNGRLVISDMYIREGTPCFHSDNERIHTCILNAFVIEELKEVLKEAGFGILLYEDHTRALKECMANIILSYGNLDRFYEMVMPGASGSLCDSGTNVKLGYFLLIAQKLL